MTMYNISQYTILIMNYLQYQNFINHTPANYLKLIVFHLCNGVYVLFFIFLFLKAEFSFG